MPASRAPALGEPSRGLSRRQPGDGSRWDGALAARRRGGGEASLAGCARQRERPAGILPATAAASCDSRPSSAATFCSLDSLAKLRYSISRGHSSVPKAQCVRLLTSLYLLPGTHKWESSDVGPQSQKLGASGRDHVARWTLKYHFGAESWRKMTRGLAGVWCGCAARQRCC